jgi:hypothetical protein
VIGRGKAAATIERVHVHERRARSPAGRAMGCLGGRRSLSLSLPLHCAHGGRGLTLRYSSSSACSPGYRRLDSNGDATCLTTSAPAFLASCSVTSDDRRYTSRVYARSSWYDVPRTNRSLSSGTPIDSSIALITACTQAQCVCVCCVCVRE